MTRSLRRRTDVRSRATVIAAPTDRRSPAFTKVGFETKALGSTAAETAASPIIAADWN